MRSATMMPEIKQPDLDGDAELESSRELQSIPTKAQVVKNVEVTYILPSGTGFCVIEDVDDVDSGQTAFIPASVIKSTGLSVGDKVKAFLTRNTHQNSARVPFFCSYVDLSASAQPTKASEEEEAEQMRLISSEDPLTKKIIDFIEEVGVCSSRAACNHCFGDDDSKYPLVYTRLIALHANGVIAGAMVRRVEGQIRASMVLYGRDVAAFSTAFTAIA